MILNIPWQLVPLILLIISYTIFQIFGGNRGLNNIVQVLFAGLCALFAYSCIIIYLGLIIIWLFKHIHIV